MIECVCVCVCVCTRVHACVRVCVCHVRVMRQAPSTPFRSSVGPEKGHLVMEVDQGVQSLSEAKPPSHSPLFHSQKVLSTQGSDGIFRFDVITNDASLVKAIDDSCGTDYAPGWVFTHWLTSVWDAIIHSSHCLM